jgi:hypothetical protein
LIRSGVQKATKCIECAEYKRCKESAASIIFFVVGLIAVIAVRAVTILEHVKPAYGKIAWYIGILGFVIYFAYKYKTDHSRSMVIRNSKLVDKILHGDRINYLIIFVSSAVVLIMAFYLDLLR